MSDFPFLLRQRYGSGPTPEACAETDLIARLLEHRSVRAYLPDPVGDAELNAMIAAAQSASSSSNLQAWSVIAVRDAQRRAALAKYAGEQAHVCDAPLQLVWLADLARLRRLAQREGRPADGLDYLEMFLVGVIDAALAAQNAVAAAESLGLGTVYIGGMRNRPEDVARLLELPAGVVAVFGLCVGRPDPAKPASVKPRPPQAVVLHQERYSLAAQDDGIDSYNRSMADFYTSQGMTVRGSWSVHCAKRVAGPQSLSGRDRLVEALRGLGFPLR